VHEAENTRYDLLKYSHLPDHSNPFDCPHWFRTSFALSTSYQAKVVRLHLDGINYRADVWMNGQQVANVQDVVGMFKRSRFDISKFAKTGGRVGDVLSESFTATGMKRPSRRDPTMPARISGRSMPLGLP
jgi:beta-galactosidase/beta-glucuronidase